MDFVLREKVRTHSLLVIRNGFVVADAYFYPYMPNTRHDLLMMESGLQCINSPTEVTLFQMLGSPDWIQYMLDLPMTDAPGTRFAYNSGAVHLLSAIVHKTSGMKALEFARRHLFEPLGISDVLWPADPRGEDNHGWGDLQLRPPQRAKPFSGLRRQGWARSPSAANSNSLAPFSLLLKGDTLGNVPQIRSNP